MGNKRLSRRDFLLLMGVGGGGVVALCTCSATAGLIIATRDRTTPDATPPSQILPTQSNANPLSIISRESWGALPPDHTASNEYGFYSLENTTGWRIYDGELVDVYQTVVVHHSVMYSANDQTTLNDIQDSHRNQRGWADVGYHYFVGKQGDIFQGRALQVRGAHVAGFNTGSVGVCLLGNFMNDTPTEPQVTMAARLVNWLAGSLQLTHLAAHRDFNDGTQCPGDNLVPYLREFATLAGLATGVEGYQPPPEQQTPEANLGGCGCCGCGV